MASHLAFARWCEVEIHHVDLGLGYRPEDWSDVFVERMLPRMLKGLPSRCDRRVLLGWTLGSRRRPLTGSLELNRIGRRWRAPSSAIRRRRRIGRAVSAESVAEAPLDV